MGEPIDATPGAGERAHRARRRRLQVIIGALMLSGFGVGFFSSMFEREGGGFLEGIPAAWAIAASVILVVSVIFGSIRYFRTVDELERNANYWAAAMALNLYFVGYPVWYLLWKGALVPEPSHEALFVATFIACALAYGWKKFRS